MILDLFSELKKAREDRSGDPDACLAKARGSAAIGVDRSMALMAFGALPQPVIISSIRLSGEPRLPALAKES